MKSKYTFNELCVCFFFVTVAIDAQRKRKITSTNGHKEGKRSLKKKKMKQKFALFECNVKGERKTKKNEIFFC